MANAELDGDRLLRLLGLKEYQRDLLAEEVARLQAALAQAQNDPHTGNAEAGQ